MPSRQSKAKQRRWSNEALNNTNQTQRGKAIDKGQANQSKARLGPASQRQRLRQSERKQNAGCERTTEPAFPATLPHLPFTPTPSVKGSLPPSCHVGSVHGGCHPRRIMPRPHSRPAWTVHTSRLLSGVDDVDGIIDEEGADCTPPRGRALAICNASPLPKLFLS